MPRLLPCPALHVTLTGPCTWQVMRDQEVEKWRFRERHLSAAQRFQQERSADLLAQFEEEDEKLVGAPFGSGYPGGASLARRSPASLLTAKPTRPLPYADDVTKKWLARSFDPMFGFPSFARFSWSTTKKIIDADGVAVDWCVLATGLGSAALRVLTLTRAHCRGEDEDEDAANQQSITGFFGAKGATPGASAQRCEFFQSRGISRATTF